MNMIQRYIEGNSIWRGFSGYESAKSNDCGRQSYGRIGSASGKPLAVNSQRRDLSNTLTSWSMDWSRGACMALHRINDDIW